MSTLQELATIEAVRVRVTSSNPEGPVDVFLLELPFDAPSQPLDDAVYLGAFAAVVGSSDNCVVHIGREHRFGANPGNSSEVGVTLGPSPALDSLDLTRSVTEAFRAVIEAAGRDTPASLGHDEALRAAVARVRDLLPDVDAAQLSVSTEEHLDFEWVIRLVEPDLTGFEVRIGFVDGHPGSTHIRRVHAEEVTDSIGMD